MSITTTLAQIRSMVDGSSGIVTSFTTQPGSIEASQCPAAITLAGPARWQEQALGLKRQDRTYTINVYVRPIMHGMGIGEGYAVCEPILNALGNTFLAKPTGLTLGGTVDHIQSIRDGGIRGDLTFGDIAYHGFSLSFEVTEKST